MGRLQILVGSVLWGTTGTSQALLPGGAEPLAVAAVRLSLGGIALVGIAATLGLLRKMDARPVAVAVISLVAAQLSFFAAVDLTGVAVGTIVAIGSSPIAAGALAWAIRGERPGVRWMVATVLGVSGCVLLVASGREVDVDPLGVALALVVGLGYAGYILATKDLVEAHPPNAVIATVFGASAVCLAPVLFVVDLRWATQPRGALIALHLGLVTVALAYTLFSRGLMFVSAATAVTLTLAEPLTAAVLGVVVLDERLNQTAGLGCGLVLAGLLLLTVPDGGNKGRS